MKTKHNKFNLNGFLSNMYTVATHFFWVIFLSASVVIPGNQNIRSFPVKASVIEIYITSITCNNYLHEGCT